MQPTNGYVFWITGLSGSGKTTIGRELVNTIRNQNKAVVFLDGDELRAVLGNSFGYDSADRLKISLCYARLCKNISQQGLNVVCSTVSLFEQTQKWNRENIKNYLEIFIKVPMDELKDRDFKGVYTKNSNIVGVDMQPHFPLNPEIIINNYNGKPIQDSVLEILSLIEKESMEI